MAPKRKPFQGVVNIIRFNWHFYVITVILFAALFLLTDKAPELIQSLLKAGGLIAAFSIIISLSISFYIYDLSDLYHLKWIDTANNGKILNIHAGFDETSEIIRDKFVCVDLITCDFYDPTKHTEVSIKRARKLYPPSSSNIAVQTNQLPFTDDVFDTSLTVLSAHEIRNQDERICFIKELGRITKPSGQILVTEHLRDFNNFLAYTIGFFHFYSRKNWLQTFQKASLTVKQEVKITPFISIFVLVKNGNTD